MRMLFWAAVIYGGAVFMGYLPSPNQMGEVGKSNTHSRALSNKGSGGASLPQRVRSLCKNDLQAFCPWAHTDAMVMDCIKLHLRELDPQCGELFGM